MTARAWTDERETSDAPIWLSNEEASSWADGYNAAVRASDEIERVTFTETGNTGTVRARTARFSLYDGGLGPWLYVDFDDGLSAWVTEASVS